MKETPEFKKASKRINDFFVYSTFLAIIFHAMVLIYGEYQPKPYQLREEEPIEIIEPPPDIEIPPPPPEIQKPQIPVPVEPEESKEEKYINETIPETDFNINLPAPPVPPPPKVKVKVYQEYFESPPVLIQGTQKLPEYTEEARHLGIEGTVILKAGIDENGEVGNIELIKGLGYGLDESAISAVKSWKFKPALQNNKPVAVWMIIPIRFVLEN